MKICTHQSPVLLRALVRPEFLHLNFSEFTDADIPTSYCAGQSMSIFAVLGLDLSLLVYTTEKCVSRIHLRALVYCIPGFLPRKITPNDDNHSLDRNCFDDDGVVCSCYNAS